jgi:hypothetical protein
MLRLIAHLRGNLVAYLALFVALSGTAYAAKALPNNSVGTKQLKKRAVTGAKVKNNTITGRQVRESTLAQVPSAARAGAADTATNATNALNAQNAANAGTLAGQPPSAFLPAGGKAADSALLDGQPRSSFLAAGAKAADSEKWDGIDSAVLGNRVTVLGSGFHPREDDATDRIYVSTGSISCGGTNETFHAPVHLPQGATVVGIDYGFIDNAAAGASSLDLTAFDALGDAPLLSDTIVTATSTGDDSNRRKVSATAPDVHVVDNAKWAYALTWSPSACSTEHQLAGGSVRYTLPTG